MVAGWLTGTVGPVLLAAVLIGTGSGLGLANEALLFLSLTVAAALLGGFLPALASAVVGSVLLNYFFAPPLRAWAVAEPVDVLTLVVFVKVGLSVAALVDAAARRTQQAARLHAEADTLSFLASSLARGEAELPALLEHVRETFAIESVALLERSEGRKRWVCADAVGPVPAARPEDADMEVPAGEGLVLTLRGRTLPSGDRRVLGAYAAQAAVALERRRLRAEAEQARRLEEANRLRTALLAAVSHDVRTPLAAIKASVTSLRADDIAWSEEDEAELLAAVEEGADRLAHLVGNLLDMSRLHTGTVVPLIVEIDLDEVVPPALKGVPEDAVILDIPEGLPMVAADVGLLERVVANVVENAVKHSPPGQAVLLSASVLDDCVELRTVDRGPGVPDSLKEEIFEPFQRDADATRGNGVGLGLAVARGFAEAQGGTLTAEGTPGGGLTMVLTLRTPPGRRPVGTGHSTKATS
ncbi:hypothetical protein N566_06470 [Streptomycetaceae bacterium MP113-05]|nr:hypothetical protein N566_06470 [Streptomycetaceae bacterium MP113-05]